MLVLLAFLLLIAGIFAATPVHALANGDPASHVLPSKEVFVPSDPSLCSEDGRRLDALTETARRKGYPIKVAVIPTGEDLGTLFRLFGRPAEYAQMLSSELPPGVFEREGRRPPYRLLVLMPGAAGLNRADRKEAAALKEFPIDEEAGKEELTRLAIELVTKLARSGGTSLGSPKPKPPCPDIDIGAPSSKSGSGSGTAILIVGIVVAMLALAWFFGMRGRKGPPPQ